MFLLTAAVCFVGCQGQQKTEVAKHDGALLLSVDFKPNVPLKYRFVCERHASVDLDPSNKYSNKRPNASPDKGKTQNTTEKLEMEIVYKPVAVDPYGYSTIEATCISAKATRISGSAGHGRADAVQYLEGKSFTFKITPTGKVTDYSSLANLVKELGEKAFGGASDSKKGRVKNPDMIMDFLATQWNMWGSVANIKNPVDGVKPGDKWQSQLLAPMPFVSKIGRDVESDYAGIVKSDKVSCAEIKSTYSLSASPPGEVPMPYGGSFQMRGMFGFLRGYRVISIEGSGVQLYDINRGLIKSDTQHYKARVSASIFGIGNGTLEPNIEIDQTMTMTLVE